MYGIDGARRYRRYWGATTIKHQRQQWVARREHKLQGGNALNYYGGTCLANGVWSRLKSHVPATMNTYAPEDQAWLEMYAHTFAWKARRARKSDLFPKLGLAVSRDFKK